MITCVIKSSEIPMACSNRNRVSSDATLRGETFSPEWLDSVVESKRTHGENAHEAPASEILAVKGPFYSEKGPNFYLGKFSLGDFQFMYDIKLNALYHGASGKVNFGWVVKTITSSYWYPRLKRGAKVTLWKKYILPRKFSDLKSILDTSDAIAMSFMIAFPEQVFSYSFFDKLHVSVISTCVCDSFTNFLKERKRYQKQLRKSFLSDTILPKPPRRCGFYRKILRFLEDRRRTREGLFLCAILTNTRAAGLPDSRMMKESVEKFVKVTSVPSQEVKIDIESAFDKLYVLNRDKADRWKERSKISLSTMACFEQTREDGGKFKALHELDQSIGPVNHDLDTGMVIPIEGRQSIGDRTFHKALTRWECPDILKVNLAVVREPAKARTITSSSIVHSTITQPMSHLLLEYLMKIPYCTAGVGKTRDVWDLYKAIGSNKDINRDWIFKSSALCTDAETATDYGNWTVGIRILDRLEYRLGLPRWYTRVCKYLLFSPRPVIYNNREITITKRGWLMGDPITKVILTIAQCICYILSDPPENSIFRCKGDDTVTISSDRRSLNEQLLRLKEIDLKSSEDDTYISPWALNYTEEYLMLPKNRYMFWESVKKTGKYAVLAYIDYPRIRLINQVFKDQEDFGYDPSGKYALLSKESTWSFYPKGSREYTSYEIAHMMQKFYLPPKKIEDCLPVGLGGNGYRPLFWSYKNVPRNLLGIYSQLGKELRWIIDWWGGYTHHEYIIQPKREFCPLLADVTCYLFYRRHKIHLGLDPGMEIHLRNSVDLSDYKHLIRVSKSDQSSISMNPMLVLPEDFAVSESTVVASILANERYLQFDTTEALPDIKDDEPDEIFWKKQDFKKNLDDIKYFIKFWKEKYFYFRKIIRQDYYDRSVLDLIHDKYLTTKVKIPIKVSINRVLSSLSYQERHQQRLIKAVEEKKWEELPQEILADDPIIEQRIRHMLWVENRKKTVFQIITDDKRLIKTLNARLRERLRINDCSIIRTGMKAFLLFEEFPEAPQGYQLEPIMDQGALNWFEENHFVNGVYYETPGFIGDTWRIPQDDFSIDAEIKRRIASMR